jgi:hypothetical protein
MIEGMLGGLLIRLVIALAALVIALIGTWFVLRTFDSSSKIDFKKAFDMMESDAKSIALYFGLRFIGVAFIVGFVVGKAIGF